MNHHIIKYFHISVRHNCNSLGLYTDIIIQKYLSQYILNSALLNISKRLSSYLVQYAINIFWYLFTRFKFYNEFNTFCFITTI